MTQIAFPYSIDRRGRTAASEEDRHVRDLIEQVLFTSPGERVNRPNFGTPILQLVFQPNSDALATAVQATVQAAVQNHLGNRVILEELDITSEESALRITVVYSVRRTGQRIKTQFVREI